MITQKKFMLGLAKLQFNSTARIRVYKKLANYITAGVSLDDALSSIYQHASDDGAKPNRPVALVVNEWRMAVSNGEALGAAIRGYVPEGDKVLIEGGEQAGLSESLLDCIKIQLAKKKIMKVLKGGLAYPGMLVAAAIGFMMMFDQKITPAFSVVLDRQKWDGSAKTMADYSEFVDKHFVVGIVGLCLIILTIYLSLSRWTGKTRVWCEKIPPWSLYRIYAGAGFMLVLAAMTKAAIPVVSILQTLNKDSSRWFSERMGGALKFVANGENIGEALYLTGLNFPDKETVRDLRAFAEYDGFDEILREIGNQWIEEAIEKIEGQTSKLRTAALLMFFTVLATFMSAIHALQDQVSSSAGH